MIHTVYGENLQKFTSIPSNVNELICHCKKFAKHSLDVYFQFSISMTDQTKYHEEKSIETPQYVLSRRGKFMLMHNGFKFTKSCGNSAKINWKCSYKSAGRYVCHAYASTFRNADGSEGVLYRRSHCHALNNWIIFHIHSFISLNIKGNLKQFHPIQSFRSKSKPNWRPIFFDLILKEKTNKKNETKNVKIFIEKKSE